MIDVLDRPIVPEVEAEAESPPAPPAQKRGGGPRTEQGRLVSRRNALKDGLRAKVLLPDGLEAVIAARTAEFDEQFQPESPYETWLVGEIAQATAKLDRCAELTIIDLERGIDRALLCWEADRRKAADALAARLPRDPGRVARALSGSRQGADWMIEHWEGLGAVLQAHGGWDDAQRRLAFDLLGVAPELRDGSDKVPPANDAAALAGLVAEEVYWLRKAQEVSLVPLDQAERSMAAAGMPLEEDACTARLRRYEARIRRELRWAHGELRRVREGLPPSPSPASGPGRGALDMEPTQVQPPLSTEHYTQLFP
jgi:hypothetical protein